MRRRKLLSVYLDKQTDKAVADSRLAFGYSAKKICEQDKIIRQNVIKKICVENGADIPEHIHIELIDNALFKSGCVDLCGNFRAVVKQGILRIENTDAINNFGEEILFADVINKEFTFDNIKYFVKEITDFDDLTDNPIYLSEKETKNAVIRTRRQGDKIFSRTEILPSL